jgi:hypothetical protein
MFQKLNEWWIGQEGHVPEVAKASALVRALHAFNLRLIDDWKAQALKLWSIRIALFWGGLSGLVAVWSAFSDIIPLPVYAGFSVLATMAIAGARVTKQPGADE